MTDAVGAAAREWDVIVVGTGVGGATVGRSLALQGFSVLFLEKGTRVQVPKDSYAPGSLETGFAGGWWPLPVSQQTHHGDRRRFLVPVGCAQGGTSIHYAAALERLDASDFDGLQTQSGSIPPWASSFAEFEPYYEAAEKLFGISTDDVAERRISEWDRALMSQMRKNGLTPKPLHVAMKYDALCQECIGKVCPRDCKADARVACLEEALRQPQCQILDGCEVQTLVAGKQSIQEVKAIHAGLEVRLRARRVVLSAGALHTPQILLRSRNEFWPQGLANGSDQVGRNLMFHTSDLYAIWAPRRFDRQARQRKSISVRDFYVRNGQRLGYIQSMGLDAGRGEIAVFIKDQLRRRGVRNETLLSLLAKVPSHLGALLFGHAGIFVGMTEDDPHPDNRIVLDPDEPDGASFHYEITPDLRRRADELRVEFSRSCRPWRMLHISPALEMNYGHPCGTCRFGDDAASSVLDRDCRAHEVENLYVVDSSFMPRSGASNPSLTIAANALRVAPRIAASLRSLT